MKPVSSTEIPPIKFKIRDGKASEKFVAPASKIGWMHSLADQPGAKFDVVIKDALGRVIFKRDNIGGESVQQGELLNFDVKLGEELIVEIENARGADAIDLFLN